MRYPEKNGLKEPTPEPVLQLEVLAPKPLDKLLERHLNLAGVNRHALGESLNDGELERLVALAPAQAHELLETEGYFLAVVRASIEPGDPPRVRVQVQPGPRVWVASARFELHGPAQADAERGQRPRRAAQSWSDLRPAVGYGAGVRYGSPVGQLKLDLAWGHETRQAWLHLTVDVPF